MAWFEQHCLMSVMCKCCIRERGQSAGRAAAGGVGGGGFPTCYSVSTNIKQTGLLTSRSSDSVAAVCNSCGGTISRVLPGTPPLTMLKGEDEEEFRNVLQKTRPSTLAKRS